MKHGRPQTLLALMLVIWALAIVGLVDPQGVHLRPAAAPPSGGSSSVAFATSFSGLAVITDNSITQAATVSGGDVTVTDSTRDGQMSAHARSYILDLTVSPSAPSTAVRLVTVPVTGWSFPDQLPAGADNLPPLSDWRWSVYQNGIDDTSNWTASFSAGTLIRTTTLVSISFIVIGVTTPVVPVTVDALNVSSSTPTGVGAVVPYNTGSGPAFTVDPDYASLPGALHPAVLRFGLATAGTMASWDTVNDIPRFNFTGFDAIVHLSSQVGSQVVLSLPAGTWGDGNILPPGMPLDTSMPVPMHGTIGYFPTPAAWVSYVYAIVNHTISSGENVTYWNIGNEMPLVNSTLVSKFITVFNLAEHAIHAEMPKALVGSDVMTDRNYLIQFAQESQHVGFLSFHYYPSTGICVVNDTYCPPRGGSGNGSPSPQLFRPLSDISHIGFYPPHLAQILWHNITRHWVPILDTETNLAGTGGNVYTSAVGTDPRQQTLMGAAWLVSTLMNATHENVSSLTYYMLSGYAVPPPSLTTPFGGWGFGMTSEGTADNDTRYAPYWALSLWAQGNPAGSTPLPVSSDPTGVIGAVSTRNQTTIQVTLVNRVNVPVEATLHFPGINATVTSARVLDNRSYQMIYDSSTQTTQLWKSGVAYHANPGSAVNISGYGVVVVSATIGVPHGSNGSGNGTNQSSNSTGNGTSSGNHTSSGGNGTGKGTNNGTSSGGNASKNLTGNVTPPNNTVGTPPGGNHTTNGTLPPNGPNNTTAPQGTKPPARSAPESTSTIPSLLVGASSRLVWGVALIGVTGLAVGIALRAGGPEENDDRASHRTPRAR